MRRPLVHRFTDVWRTEKGNKVRASLQDAPDISQEADFAPRRIFVMERTPLAGAGTVLFRGDRAYLLILQDELDGLMRFRAMRISHCLPWVRRGVTVDPVTKMETQGSPQIMNALLPVVVEPLRGIEDHGIDREKNSIFTGSAVAIGDFVGPHEIHHVTHVLGVLQLQTY